MTHEELGKYLGLTMVLKRLVMLLPPEQRETLERNCRSLGANASQPDEDGKVKAELLEIGKHLTQTLDDIFIFPARDV